jgi:hypothetical protein
MNKFSKLFTIVIALAVVFVACEKSDEVAQFETKSIPASAPTDRGVAPVRGEGNFTSTSDVQLCYDMLNQTYTGEVKGFKVDPPVNLTTDLYLSTTLSDDGRYLAWEIDEDKAKLLGFVIKGGSAFNTYNYANTTHNDDGSLVSPFQVQKNGKLSIPQISHYNVCYYVIPTGEFQGCTPGYWSNHADRWVGVSTETTYFSVFGVTPLNGTEATTLGQVISNVNTYGSDAFHAVAAILNAYSASLAPEGDSYGQFVNYPYDVDDVKGFVSAGNFSVLKTANEVGCPLNGSRAVKV